MNEVQPCFPPTLDAALARIADVRPAAYARSRNALNGAVSRLSPYLTHGFVSLPEVAGQVAGRHALPLQHKFLFELGWRAYFEHVWAHRGDGILQSLHAGPLPDEAYADRMPDDLREARTGVPVIDLAVRTLYDTGYLHNHARMWLASYVVHLRKVHWRVGADWMVAYLLDGDLASNHLSWQWVAGTASHKPYLFNADNVARYAPSAWHSPGSVIDTSYEALAAMAALPQRDSAPPAVSASSGAAGIEPPALMHQPPALHGASASAPADVTDRDVWLVHPWALADPPPDRLCIGWWPMDHHQRWPWSAARWAFVGERMAQLTPVQWAIDRATLAQRLATARSVHTQANLHVDRWLPPGVQRLPAPSLFPPLSQPCASFSAFWHRCTRERPAWLDGSASVR